MKPKILPLVVEIAEGYRPDWLNWGPDPLEDAGLTKTITRGLHGTGFEAAYSIPEDQLEKFSNLEGASGVVADAIQAAKKYLAENAN